MPDAPRPPDAPPVAIVGAGAMGTTLARRMSARGYPIRAVISRTQSHAQRLASAVDAAVASDASAALPSDVRLVLLCVPDDAIASVAEALAGVAHPWTATVVAHTSGRQPAAALTPLASAGATALSFHPLLSVTADTPHGALDGVAVGIEGPDDAIAAGRGLAQALGLRPVVLSAADKARYHCAAALASNGLVALMSAVQEVLSSTDLDDPSPSSLFGPLVEQTWAHLKAGGPEAALTGPVARGDQETVEAHLEALRKAAPHLMPLYASLSTELVRTAVRRGALDADAAETLLGTLQTALDGSSP